MNENSVDIYTVIKDFVGSKSTRKTLNLYADSVLMEYYKMKYYIQKKMQNYNFYYLKKDYTFIIV